MINSNCNAQYCINIGFECDNFPGNNLRIKILAIDSDTHVYGKDFRRLNISIATQNWGSAQERL